MSDKLITVFGATGAQGSSVLRSLAANVTHSFALRGITRDPSSSTSQALRAAVPKVSLVQADGWDKPSLVTAFQGSWGAFVNTNSDDAVFENPDETRTEFDLGKNIIDAAIDAGVEVLVYSGLSSAKEISGGKVTSQAFDEKHAIGEYAKATGAFKAVIITSPGFYFENFLIQDIAPIFGGFPFIPSDDGTLIFRVPSWGGKGDGPFISITDDYGDIVHGIFLEPNKWDKRSIQCVSEAKSFDDVVLAFERATGKKAQFDEVKNWQDLDVYGIRSLETIKSMFGFCQVSGGKYFGEPTETATALELKQNAAAASGKPAGQTKLSSLEEFFRREFTGQ